MANPRKNSQILGKIIKKAEMEVTKREIIRLAKVAGEKKLAKEAEMRKFAGWSYILSRLKEKASK